MKKNNFTINFRPNLRSDLNIVLLLLASLFVFTACSTMDFLKYDKEELLRQNKEFDKQVVIQEAPVEAVPETGTNANTSANTNNNKNSTAASQDLTKSQPPTAGSMSTDATTKSATTKKTDPAKKTKAPAAKATTANTSAKKATAKDTPAKPTTRQPDIEDTAGFTAGARTPDVNPFRVGEKVVHSVRYFSAEAGTLNLEVRPFLIVNGRKSYNFYIGLKTSSLFSKFYSVDDTVQTYLDFEDMVPYVFKINVRESGKLAQAHSYFDQNTLKANFWEKKYTEKSGEEETKKSWDILPFSQNAFSGIFYMRIFEWKVGKEYSFRVSDDEKNVVFKGTALAKEKIQTDAGTFDAIKIRANILSRGALTQAGDLLLWISDDDRKFILRIEAKIKIGTLVSEAIEIHKGSP